MHTLRFPIRAVFCGLLIASQALALVAALWLLCLVFPILWAFLYAAGAITALFIVSRPDNASYKLSWSILILLFPFFGWIFYLLFGGGPRGRWDKERHRRMTRGLPALLPGGKDWDEALKRRDPTASLQSRALFHDTGYPLWPEEESSFLSPGEVAAGAILSALRSASRFIFLEYFIIDEGEFWQEILSILEEKAAGGVEVRVLYDDCGCLALLPSRYPAILRKKGIDCQVFSRLRPGLLPQLNQRDHRKLMVVDGVVGFCGGINLADEYINRKELHGHWKDAALLLRGQAVGSLTVQFLQLWNRHQAEPEDYRPYLSEIPERLDGDGGWIQPFADHPASGRQAAKQACLQLICRAEHTIHIETPYLILDDEMRGALCRAAASGVDVVVVTPHLGDKWYVHAATRSNYPALLAAGVHIYEYTPGFIHTKSVVADGKWGLVGSVNFDFRSFFLHYENAVWMAYTRAIGEAEKDFERLLSVSAPVSPDFYGALPWYTRLFMGFLQWISPLM